MVTVEEAEKIVLSQIKDFGTESISLDNALGRVLAEDITADRDLPPYNRVSMDGIAIRYASFEKGNRSFHIKATQAAGETPVDIGNEDDCIEIMTGAAISASADTVIRYEDLDINNSTATVKIESIIKGQNIHLKGADRVQHEVVVKKDSIIDPSIINIAASVGKAELLVKKLPRVVVITTGDELVEVNDTPSPYQLRRSNNYALKAVLQQYCIDAELIHIPDDHSKTKQVLQDCIDKYDVILLSGGVSAGKFDYVPGALEELGVEKLFYQVQQRPGKPFWFGTHANGVLVFAFPGNPVSTFMCLHRYFVPWLQACLAISVSKSYAILAEDIQFKPNLKYFLQVKLNVNEDGHIIAKPIEGHGSGDLANLVEVDAFMELPAERINFNSGEVYRLWPFKRIII
jgi:molybdopterin molybdotransferase